MLCGDVLCCRVRVAHTACCLQFRNQVCFVRNGGGKKGRTGKLKSAKSGVYGNEYKGTGRKCSAGCSAQQYDVLASAAQFACVDSVEGKPIARCAPMNFICLSVRSTQPRMFITSTLLIAGTDTMSRSTCQSVSVLHAERTSVVVFLMS